MMIQQLRDDTKPSFCWDRDWSIGEIKRRLRETDGFERYVLIAWILREATFVEAWSKLSPREVFPILSKVLPFLGRRREYWRYTFDVWHKLGKV